MPNAEQLAMIDLDVLTNPLSFRYNLSGPWGVSSMVFTFEVPELFDKLPETLVFGQRMWHDFIATAISHHWRADFMEIVRWKQTPLPVVWPVSDGAGRNGGRGSDRKDSGMIVLHSGHADGWGRYRLALPGLPQNWVNSNQLNDSGITELYKWAAILFMGTASIVGGSNIRWLLHYADVLPMRLDNLRGVAFRDIYSVRICSYCDEAPDSVPIDWP